MKKYDRNSLVRVSYFIFGLSVFFAFLGFITGKEITDSIFNLGIGLIFFFVAITAKRGMILAIYLVGFEIVCSLLYSFFMGRGINYVTLVFGAIWAFWLYNLWKEGELK